MRPLCAPDIRSVTTVFRDASIEVCPLRLPVPSRKDQMCIAQVDTIVPVQIALIATRCEGVLGWQTAAYVHMDVDMEMHRLTLPPPMHDGQECVAQIDTIVPVQIELVASRGADPRRWHTVSITEELGVS